MKRLPRPTLILLNLALLAASIISAGAQDTAIIDSEHYSSVFGETRHYRIFLPPSYVESPQKRYPVIYFYHGWSQRYFGSSDHYADFDRGNDNEGDNIANFVATHDVIVVKADGYNRSPNEKYYVRPYNVGPVETNRQFPLYFPELVEHIDTHYHTIADREHRAVSGLSMGGFMTFWIAGKYPHLLCAAGNFCGSPEFVVGPRDFPVEYRHMDLYNNYAGVNLRLHYGDKDFIRGYHKDLNRVWSQVLDNYSWKVYEAAHSTCGLGDMFAFLLRTFEHPPAVPSQWNHIDVYPEFFVWDYQVRSDRNVPGFTVLENVDKRGFRCAVREFLPDGELLPSVSVSVTTPALYKKNTPYIIHDMDMRNMKTFQYPLRSDGEGRLTIFFNGSSHDIGINAQTDKPNVVIASTQILAADWPLPRKDIKLSISLVNKGVLTGTGVSAELTATRNTTLIKQNKSFFGKLAPNEVQDDQTPFVFQVMPDSIEIVKFKLTIKDDHENEWVQFMEIPIRKDAPELRAFEIADGKTFIVASGGDKTDTLTLGAGNGDGIANPGESIVVLVKDQNKYWRTNLFSSDMYINPFGVNDRESDYWGDYDHVGASAKYSIPLIASDCPQNHVINFFAEYWLPDNLQHIKKQGLIKITVKGEDKTAPQFHWVHVSGDNTVQVKLYDGAEIKTVTAKIMVAEDVSKFLMVELKDEGTEGDRTAADHIFSRKVPDQEFGIYRISIEATDSFGNKVIRKSDEDFVFH